MALPTFTPPLAPSVGLKRRPEVKLLKAEFGDGYTQISRDGLNHIRQVVELQWDFLSGAYINELIAFFQERGGDLAFNYQVFGETASRKWRCEEWETSALNIRGYGSFRAVLRECFDSQS